MTIQLIVLNRVLLNSSAVWSDQHAWSCVYDHGICQWRYFLCHSAATFTSLYMILQLGDITHRCASDSYSQNKQL